MNHMTIKGVCLFHSSIEKGILFVSNVSEYGLAEIWRVFVEEDGTISVDRLERYYGDICAMGLDWKTIGTQQAVEIGRLIIKFDTEPNWIQLEFSSFHRTDIASELNNFDYCVISQNLQFAAVFVDDPIDPDAWTLSGFGMNSKLWRKVTKEFVDDDRNFAYILRDSEEAIVKKTGSPLLLTKQPLAWAIISHHFQGVMHQWQNYP